MLTTTALRTTLILVLLSLLAGPTFAQIVITSSFYSAKAGQRETESEYEADDDGNPFTSLPCVTGMLSASGGSQSWDFTACTYSSPPLVTVTDYGTDVAGDMPEGDNPAFSSANFYMREYETNASDPASSWGVLSLTTNAVTQFGFVVVEEVAPSDYDTTVVLNDPVSTPLALPIEFGDSWSDSTTFTQEATTVAIAEDYDVDGWGTLTTPAGTASALRISNERRFFVDIGGGTFVLTETQYNYEFLTNGTISAFIYHDNAGTALGGGYISTSSTSLPVELATIDVVRDGDEAILSWTTLSELNNSGFGVEHAVDDSPFREIAFVEGAGTTRTVREYSVAFALETTGVHRFRLRQVDLDGTFTYSPVVELNYDTPERFALLPAYPNPFNPSTTITYDVAAASEITLNVFDMLGQRIRRLASGSHEPGRYEVEFDATGLPTGLYVYQLVAGSRSETRSMMLLK
jgi:hypothetical protein